jgi:uncharacterized membrane protein YfcA
MAAGLSPENWAFLALCGAALGLASSIFSIEPGFLFVPLLAILLPRFSAPGGAIAPIAIATALALVVPVSIAGLRPLTQEARRRLAWLSPAIVAAGFFGASLAPHVPGPWLFAGFAGTAIAAVTRRPALTAAKLAVTLPSRPMDPFAAISKSLVSSLFGVALPLADRPPEKAALTLLLALAGVAALAVGPAACKGCVGFVFMPALFAMGAALVLTTPLWRALFGERALPPRLRLLAGLAVVGALLASPSAFPGTRKAALAALAPGLCRASSSGRLNVEAAAHRSDPAFLLAQRLGPRRGFGPLKAGAPSQGLLALARGAAALPKTPEGSGWTAVIELQPAPPKPRKQALTTKQRNY